MATKTCNKCGRSFGLYTQDCNDNFVIHTMIGYGSKYDECILSLTLCSACMDELIDECVISPITDPYEVM